ncbi:MAG: L-histidine N(alpha)-methyltransferase [Bdellovibrionales bacterium]|nr:L-histidine N(alpha)-methyltransferase [Bdellovibrionales bacterium]
MSVKILNSFNVQDQGKAKEQFALDVLKGLSTKPKEIPSKYFYDDEGSRLFSQIMESEDYYLTDCEIEVFEKNKKDIAQKIGHSNINIIELGAGDGRKTKILIDQFLKENLSFKYTSIDISKEAIVQIDRLFKEEFPALEHTGVVGEYTGGLDWVSDNQSGRKLVLFLGSTIGNFDRPNALVFLRVLWKHLNNDDLLLIGFDLKKEIDLMLLAYNDREGITKKFNFNLLTRMNNELGANFDLKNFMHFGTYNPNVGAMESFIISTCAQEVYVGELEKTFKFKAFEPIHLEYSHKYLISDIESFAMETGFEVLNHYFDSNHFYTNSLWRVKKEMPNG